MADTNRIREAAANGTLTRLYEADQLTMKQLAIRYEVNIGVVKRLLQKIGACIRPRGVFLRDSTRNLREAAENGTLRRLYVDEKTPAKIIADQYQVSNHSVMRLLQGMDIVIRSIDDENKRRSHAIFPISREALFHLYYRQGLSEEQIAKKAGVKRGNVRARMREYGYSERSNSEAQKIGHLKGYIRAIQVKHYGEEARERMRETGRNNLSPEARAKGGRISIRRYNKSRQGAWVNCHWCGERIYRQRCQLGKYRWYSCSDSHKALSFNHDRWHCDEPRPLILERLRNGETGIGESQIERDALAMERLQPVVPRPIPALKPASVPQPPAQRRQKPIAAEEVGPLGEALLKADREGKELVGNGNGRH